MWALKSPGVRHESAQKSRLIKIHNVKVSVQFCFNIKLQPEGTEQHQAVILTLCCAYGGPKRPGNPLLCTFADSYGSVHLQLIKLSGMYSVCVCCFCLSVRHRSAMH